MTCLFVYITDALDGTISCQLPAVVTFMPPGRIPGLARNGQTAARHPATLLSRPTKYTAASSGLLRQLVPL